VTKLFRGIALAVFLIPMTVAAQAPGASPNGAPGRNLGEGSYENCMRLARNDPEQAFETALSWQDMGGGAAARHCVAVAMIGLGQYAPAAKRLEKLAVDMKAAPAAARAAILDQAGMAWYEANDNARANAALTAALKRLPGDPEILIDRAMVLAAAKNYWEAIDDLNAVIAANPDRADARILRASAYRYVDALPLAREDADAALRLAPDRAEVLLEHGIILRLSGDPDGARRDWLKLIRLHDGTPAADAARRNLEKLDVRIR